jgi:hypothetical protein
VRVVLLGPQRRPVVDTVVRSLGRDGRIATITAGWQEREPDDAELSTLLSGRDTNLRLYRRWLDVQDRDPEFAAAERRRQEVLGELAEIYLLRLDHALQAVYDLQRRNVRDQLQAGALADAIAAVRELDAAHLRHVNDVRLEFFEQFPPHERPAIAAHRAAVAALLGDSVALTVAGGHVGVLADVMHLFNIAAALRSSTRCGDVIAWSAGAMALTDRIVLFHDRSARGPGHPEVYGSGLSVLRDVVLLPHARARLLLDDKPRMAVFARRFGPARCILLEAGTRLEVDGDGDGARPYPAGTQVLAEDGHVTALEAA